MNNIEVKVMRVDELRPHPKNPRKHKAKGIDKLVIGMGAAYIAAIHKVVEIWTYDGFTNANITELVMLSILLGLALGGVYALSALK